MLSAGILCGFLAAFLQSLSYIASKRFLLRVQRPLYLTVYAQIAMGAMAAVVLLGVWPFFSMVWSVRSGLLLSGVVGFTAWSQVAFFLTLREMEPRSEERRVGKECRSRW